MKHPLNPAETGLLTARHVMSFMHNGAQALRCQRRTVRA